MSMMISCKQQYLSITTAHTRCEYGCWYYDIVTLEYERNITAKMYRVANTGNWRISRFAWHDFFIGFNTANKIRSEFCDIIEQSLAKNLTLYDGDIFITWQVPEFEVIRGFIKFVAMIRYNHAHAQRTVVDFHLCYYATSFLLFESYYLWWYILP